MVRSASKSRAAQKGRGEGGCQKRSRLCVFIAATAPTIVINRAKLTQEHRRQVPAVARSTYTQLTYSAGTPFAFVHLSHPNFLASEKAVRTRILTDLRRGQADAV